uniref:Uncharacterized protein n=1 Tax=Erpetoichthys calabaricus TaxID=27687 RepID=A0A8C4T4H7_ERPCA
MALLTLLLIHLTFPLTSTLVTLTFPLGITTSIQVDFCSIVDCGSGRQVQWVWSDKYVCVTTSMIRGVGHSMRGSYLGGGYVDVSDDWCNLWTLVFANTGTHDWGHEPWQSLHYGLKARFSIIKGHNNDKCSENDCNPLIITLKNPSFHDSGTYVLGAHVSGTDPLGQFKIQVTKPPPPTTSKTPSLALPHNPPIVSPTPPIQIPQEPITYLNITTLSSTFSIETGYGDQNRWLQWVLYSARQVNQSDCYACATARPHLATTPFPLTDLSDPTGFPCLLYLFTTALPPTDPKCNTLNTLFPPIQPMTPPMFRPYIGNYICFTRSSHDKNAVALGSPPPLWCSLTYDVSIDASIPLPNNISISWFISHVTARADVWWMCRRSKLLDILPPEWTGTCTPIQLVMPFRLLPLNGQQLPSSPHPHRIRRSLTSFANFSLHGPGVYIDSIGVPRGVPNKFKARDQVAAGFESLFPIITINKNVDWINYLYYNQQRFLNFTKEAVEGIHEQLDKTSLMTWQNRLALDMLLAEKGGVCAMFGDACCTYIPNNTAPDGSITRALAGLTALSLELAENSGIDTPLDEWFISTFGSWGQWFKSIFVSLLVALAIILLVCCCLIPLIRHFIQKLFSASMTKAYFLHTEHMNLLFQSRSCSQTTLDQDCLV